MNRTLRVALSALAIGFGLNGALPLGSSPDVAQAAQSKGRWYSEAEKTFRLGPGIGRQLMTEQEWREHQHKMRGMKQADRDKYREEWHQKMIERAREKGIKIPESPPRKGPGPGAGPGGPGKR